MDATNDAAAFAGINPIGPNDGAVVTTKRIFPRAIDISQHKFLNFLVFGNADPINIDTTGGKIFFLRAGNDTNFFEVRVPLNFSGWKKIRVEQIDRNGDSIADAWRSVTPGTVIVSSGAASLQAVGQLQVGVRNVTATPQTSGILYVNEIFVSQPVIRVGTAIKLDMNFEVPGWATFGAKHRSVDRNFRRRPPSVEPGQPAGERLPELHRLSYLPMTFNLSRVITETRAPPRRETSPTSSISCRPAG